MASPIYSDSKTAVALDELRAIASAEQTYPDIEAIRFIARWYEIVWPDLVAISRLPTLTAWELRANTEKLEPRFSNRIDPEVPLLPCEYARRGVLAATAALVGRHEADPRSFWHWKLDESLGEIPTFPENKHPFPILHHYQGILAGKWAKRVKDVIFAVSMLDQARNAQKRLLVQHPMTKICYVLDEVQMDVWACPFGYLGQKSPTQRDQLVYGYATASPALISELAAAVLEHGSDAKVPCWIRPCWIGREDGTYECLVTSKNETETSQDWQMAVAHYAAKYLPTYKTP